MKRTLSAILSAVLLTSTFAAMPVSAESTKLNTKLVEALESPDVETVSVWIWLSDKDKPNFDALTDEAVSPKTEEETKAYYEMTEMERVDQWQEVRSKFVTDYFTEKSNAFLEKLGVSEECTGFVSKFTPSMIVKLTPEQVMAAAEMDEVVSITLSEPVELVPTTDELTAEQFIERVVSDTEDFSDGGFIYRGDLKFDVKNGRNGSFNLIVYGIKRTGKPYDVTYSSTDLKWNQTQYFGGGVPEFLSGCEWGVCANSNKEGAAYTNNFNVVFYIENEFPTYSPDKRNILSFLKRYDMETLKYIYPDMKTGDIDNDGSINAADASLVLQGYSLASTGEQIHIVPELFDFNGDGLVNSSDASAILAKYAEDSTS